METSRVASGRAPPQDVAFNAGVPLLCPSTTLCARSPEPEPAIFQKPAAGVARLRRQLGTL